MPRPRKAIRPVEKNISLPEDLVARVDLELYSDLEGKVPFGAWQRYVEGLIRADLERRAQGKGRQMDDADPTQVRMEAKEALQARGKPWRCQRFATVTAPNAASRCLKPAKPTGSITVLTVRKQPNAE